MLSYKNEKLVERKLMYLEQVEEMKKALALYKYVDTMEGRSEKSWWARYAWFAALSRIVAREKKTQSTLFQIYIGKG
ncbi:uncharacterized protein [Prorops nasuta]|uniref:uncharacterized protein isoform X2 n=1 Tax=Prorops nasuta TaxID=863751 RepID=UPI0034CF1CE3